MPLIDDKSILARLREDHRGSQNPNDCSEGGGECSVCAALDCPHGDLLHWHHDGCPSCDTQAVYLNLHGWELTQGTWSKPGFEATRTDVDPCGSCTTDRVVTDLTTAEAYRLQREVPSAPGGTD